MWRVRSAFPFLLGIVSMAAFAQAPTQRQPIASSRAS